MSLDLMEGRSEVKNYDLERLTMLQDGVYAIALTLLAIDLRPPASWDRTLLGLLTSMKGPLTAYLVSFALVANYWVRQRRVFARLRAADGRLTALTLAVLGLVTLIAPSARLIAEFGAAASAQAWALVLGAAGLMSSFQWIYVAFIADLVDPRISSLERVQELVRQCAAPLIIGLYGALLSLQTSRPYALWAFLLLPLVLRRTRRLAPISA